MSDTGTLVNGYIAMWNETDPDRRRELVARTLTEDASYVDPVLTGEGIDGVNEMIAGVRYPADSYR